MALNHSSVLLSPQFLNNSVLSKNLGEEFILCENGNMVFHWADFFETCDLIKTQMEKDASLQADFKKRQESLVKLSLIPIWIRTEKRIYQSTMYDLYEKFILDKGQFLGGVDPFCPLEISFISGTGPFKEMSIAECFNKNTYRDFVLVYLLHGKLPRRDYRIRLKSRVLLEYGSEYSQADLISFEQLTMNGLLFSMESEAYIKKISQNEKVRILLNTQMLKSARGKNLNELKDHLGQDSFKFLYSSDKNDSLEINVSDISVQSSFDFSKNKRIYLFISYENLMKYNNENVHVIKDFVEQTKELVREHYQNQTNLSQKIA